MKEHVIAVIEPADHQRGLIRDFLEVLVPAAMQLHFRAAPEAVAGFRNFKPTLVLVDESQAIGLFADYPRERRSFHVLVLTSRTDERSFAAIKDLGADDVCGKPLDELLLKGKVETLLYGLYASPFSFFARTSGNGGSEGVGLGAISMTFPSPIYALSETSVEFVSSVILRPGCEIMLGLGEHSFRVIIERCQPNPNRADSYFVRGGFPADVPVAVQARLRRVIARALQQTRLVEAITA